MGPFLNYLDRLKQRANLGPPAWLLPRARALKGVQWLILAMLLLAVHRVGLELTSASPGTDFDLLYHAAQHLLAGENPYPIAREWFRYPLFYPMPAVLLAIPYSFFSVQVGRILWDLTIGGLFAFALWRTRGPYALLALLSAAYLYALRASQTTPLLVAASLLPWLGFVLVVKPNIGLALWCARPNKRAVLGGAAVLLLSLLILPSWPLDWFHALQEQNQHLRPPVLRPFGFLLLLGAYRWRMPEGRLLLLLALIPQNTLPHELVPLALIPANRVEMGIYVVGTWFTLGPVIDAARRHPHALADITAEAWPVILAAVYLPMLFLVLRRRPLLPQ
jgi:hypothetical protein